MLARESLLLRERLRPRAPRVEPTPRRRVDRGRNVPFQDDPALRLGELRVGHRHRGHQRARVGVAWLGVEGVPLGGLDDLAQVHHRDAVRDVLDHGQVVRDEQVGQVELVLEILEEVEDLGLDRHVERRHRLVTHDQLGSERERASDPDPLALAARELVRVAVVVLRVQPHELHQLLDLALDLVLRDGSVEPERRADDRADRLPRVEGRVGVLEHHLHVATEVAQVPTPDVADVPAIEPQLAFRQAVEAHHHPRERRLAAPGLTDQPERLSREDLQIHAVDGVHRTDLALEDDPSRDGEMLLDALESNEGLHRRFRRGRRRKGLGRAHVRSSTSSWTIRFRSSSERWHAAAWNPSTGRSWGNST